MNLLTEDEYDEVLLTYKLSIIQRGCMKCGARLYLYNNMVRCLYKYCKYRYSIYKNTLFNCCKVNIKTYFKVLDLYLNFVPINIISRITTISKERAGKMVNKFNKIKIYLKYLENTEFGGTGNIIEIDERNFGERKYHRGHHVEDVWVFGAVERITKNTFDSGSKLIKKYVGRYHGPIY
jgi:hypothetical protein